MFPHRIISTPGALLVGIHNQIYHILIDRRWHSSTLDLHYLENPGVDGGIILRWNFRKWDVEAWAGSMWLRIGRGGGYL